MKMSMISEISIWIEENYEFIDMVFKLNGIDMKETAIELELDNYCFDVLN